MATNRKPRLLLIDDEPRWLELEGEILEKNGYDVTTATSGSDAQKLIDDQFFDLLILDQRMPGLLGSEFLGRIRRRYPDIGAIFVTGYGDVDLAVETFHLGSLDLLRKPVDSERLVGAVRRALEVSEVARENRLYWFDAERTAGFTNIVGKSTAIQKTLELVKQISPTDASVLLLGETGTGKELVARAIHERSRRRDKPFVPVNAAAISATLVESTLFGYKKGAFTDAKEDRRGYLEAADSGTLFFDEIGEMPVEFQPKLLRVLESDQNPDGRKRFTRLGETIETAVDFRLISATNRNLDEECKTGRFKFDLLSRLAMFPITLPPLRSRPEDIQPLTMHFLERHRRTLGKRVTHLAPETMEKLRGYAWPGNIRQLNHVVYRAVLVAHSETITPDLLQLPQENRTSGSPPSLSGLAFKSAQLQFEKRYFSELLERAEGNKTKAAELAGMDRSVLYEHLRNCGLLDDKSGNRREER